MQRVDEEGQAEQAEDDAGHAGQRADAGAQQADQTAAGGVFAQVDGGDDAHGNGEAAWRRGSGRTCRGSRARCRRRSASRRTRRSGSASRTSGAAAASSCRLLLQVGEKRLQAGAGEVLPPRRQHLLPHAGRDRSSPTPRGTGSRCSLTWARSQRVWPYWSRSSTAGELAGQGPSSSRSSSFSSLSCGRSSRRRSDSMAVKLRLEAGEHREDRLPRRRRRPRSRPRRGRDRRGRTAPASSRRCSTVPRKTNAPRPRTKIGASRTSSDSAMSTMARTPTPVNERSSSLPGLEVACYLNPPSLRCWRRTIHSLARLRQERDQQQAQRHGEEHVVAAGAGHLVGLAHVAGDGGGQRAHRAAGSCTRGWGSGRRCPRPSRPPWSRRWRA